MTLLLQYIIKLSISLALVWCFYYFLLRKLTFYNNNRWYLLVFTLLSFIIPFINIAPLLDGDVQPARVVSMIPVVHQYTLVLEDATQCPVPLGTTAYSKWEWMIMSAGAGSIILVLRFLIRLVSFRQIKRSAKLLSTEGSVRIYDTAAPINPFSFGNHVFVNTRRHPEQELQKIILHELVHVRQRHTIDILWAECCCVFNWYNPFVWLLRKAIRQNLEFIADQQVLSKGVDKKQYQYLLLKVTGNYPFSIANQFNFSSLKKRIAMMNKNKSARISLLRFVWLVPLAAVILVSFRRSQQSVSQDVSAPLLLPQAQSDTVPPLEPNKKGYYFSIIDNKGECTLVVKDKAGKEVKRLLLTEWHKNEEHYTSLYGELPPSPPPPPAAPDGPSAADVPAAPVLVPSTVPAPPALPEGVKKVSVVNDRATVYMKDGQIKKYNLANKQERGSFERLYGNVAAPPAPPVLLSPAEMVPPAPPPPPPVPTRETEITIAKAPVQLELLPALKSTATPPQQLSKTASLKVALVPVEKETIIPSKQ